MGGGVCGCVCGWPLLKVKGKCTELYGLPDWPSTYLQNISFFVCLFLFQISFAAVHAFQFEPALALGFFALGCSPGGSASNAYTLLLDGDVTLSVTMTFISTTAALGKVPGQPSVEMLQNLLTHMGPIESLTHITPWPIWIALTHISAWPTWVPLSHWPT